MKQATAQCAYRKTRSDQWVVMGPADVIRAGATVTVTKRDESTKTECIASIGRPFIRDGIEMVYGYPFPTQRSNRRRASRCATPAASGVPSPPPGTCPGSSATFVACAPATAPSPSPNPDHGGRKMPFTTAEQAAVEVLRSDNPTRIRLVLRHSARQDPVP